MACKSCDLVNAAETLLGSEIQTTFIFDFKIINEQFNEIALIQRKWISDEWKNMLKTDHIVLTALS